MRAEGFKRRGGLWVGIVLWAVVLVTALGGQMRPDAPVTNFIFPQFGEDGYKEWELRGKEGRYHNDNLLEVAGMVLKVYESGENLSVRTEIRSDKALMRPQTNRANGAGHFFMKGANYVIEGRAWEWWGGENRVQVSEDVQVIFAGNLNNFLK